MDFIYIYQSVALLIIFKQEELGTLLEELEENNMRILIYLRIILEQRE